MQFQPEATQPNDPTSVVTPDNESEKEHMLSKEQWNNTFRDSLRDFRLKFEEEEKARSAGEYARQDEFDRTMTNFGDILLKDHLRQQELYEKSDTLHEERFQKADAAQEAIFVQGQQDCEHAFEIEQEMREKQVVWHNTTRKGLLSDSRQRLSKKCDAFNAALMEQFDGLMKRQKGLGKVPEEQSKHQDTPILVPPDGSSGPVDLQSVTSLQPSPKSLSSPSSPHTTNGDSSAQPTSTRYNDQQDTQISQFPSSLMKSLSQPSSSSNPESLNTSMQPASPESNHQQEKSTHLVGQGASEQSIQSDGVKEDKYYSSFVQLDEKFYQDEVERYRRFYASEAARDTEESKRSAIFNQRMKWSTKSQIEHFRGREEERFRREIQRSIAFRNAESQRRSVFEILLKDIMDQAYAEEELEKIHFKHQEDSLLALYKRQAIRLDQRAEDKVMRFKVRTRRMVKPIPFSDNGGFGPSAILSGEGKLIQNALPTPSVPPSRYNPSSVRVFSKIKLPISKVRYSVKDMQMIFECCQKLRAERVKEWNYTFTINEAKREANFLKAQQERKEIFNQAEESRESEFEEAQQQRESDFEANERKREEDFDKQEVGRYDQARKAQEERAQQFQSMIVTLQKECAVNKEERLKKLDLLGERLIKSREQVQDEQPPRRSFHRLLFKGDFGQCIVM
ncbi:hypothetical protein C0993_009441 [Termitomyces sp. T159_Od127]|nr:hypothetical protein C0993_009441 [Termitomyces sp. T159_Od127]